MNTRKRKKKDVILPALQQRSQDNRDRLLAVGAKSFAKHGYEKTRVVDLAADVGVSVGVFYQRFKGKREFFDALEEEVVIYCNERWSTFFDTVGTDCSAQEFFESFVKELALTISDNIGFFRAMITLGHHDKKVTGAIAEADTVAIQLLEQYLVERKFVSRRRLRDQQLFTAYSMAAKTLLVMSLNEIGPLRATDKKTTQEIAHMLVSYLGIADS